MRAPTKQAANMSRLDEAMGDEVAELLVEACTRGLALAYNALCERHDVAMGDDGFTFGVGAWRLGSKQVAAAIQLAFPEAVVTWPHGSLHVLLGGKTFHFYRAGPDGESAVSYRLDGTMTKVRIRNSNRNQLALNLFPAASEDEAVSHLVVLHSGDPETGLDGIHIGAPTSLDGDDTTWLWMEQVWPQRLAGEATDAGPTPHTEGPRPTFSLTLRDDTAEGTQGA